jgi:hypothetical protein
VTCPDGYLAMGGGFRSNRYLGMRLSYPTHTTLGSGWNFAVRNGTTSAASVTFHATCLKGA